MRNVIIVILLGILFTECSPCRRLQKKCPPQVIRERYDSIVIRDTVMYEDRLVYLDIPGDSVTVEKTVFVKEDITPLFAENDYSFAKAWVENSKLKLQLLLKEQKIAFLLDSANTIAKHWEYKYTNEKQTEIVIQKTPLPKIFLYAFIGWIVLIVVAGVWLYIKIRTKGFKTILKGFI